MINNLLVKYLLLFHQPSGKPGGGRISFMVLLGYHLITKITEYRYRNAMEARVKQLEELSQKGKGPAEEDVITQTEIDRLRESSNVPRRGQGLDDAFSPITPSKSYSVEEDADTYLSLADKFTGYAGSDSNNFNPVSDYFDFWYNLYINSEPVVLFNLWGGVIMILCLVNIGMIYLGSHLINRYDLGNKYPILSKYLAYRSRIVRYSVRYELGFLILTALLLIILNALEYALL